MFLPVHDLLVRSDSSLRAALSVLDDSAKGIVFVVDSQGVLRGVLTDGDIRRALLRDVALTAPVSTIVKPDFVALSVETLAEDVVAALNGPIRCIPLLDSRGRPVDYASLSHLRRISVMTPDLSGNELAYLTECIRTNWISSQGKYVERFEEMFQDYYAGRYALAVSNGTAALHLGLLALGVGEGDEVLVPDLTFAACANAVIYTGATPVFVDVSRETWTMDPDKAAAAVTERTKAIMPVHLYGHPCQMEPILEIARRHRLAVIEDCAEALGAECDGKKVGSMGTVACFSFFGNKILTTGEGGMVLFKRRSRYELARMLRDHGMSQQRRYWQLRVGYNYRMTNLQAAIGVAQMERLEKMIDGKIAVAKAYTEALSGLDAIELPPQAAWARNVYWLYTVLVNTESRVSREELTQKLLTNGIETRPLFHPIHQMPPYKRFGRRQKFPVSTDLSRRGLSLPSAQLLSVDSIRDITRVIRSVLEVKGLRVAAS